MICSFAPRFRAAASMPAATSYGTAASDEGESKRHQRAGLGLGHGHHLPGCLEGSSAEAAIEDELEGIGGFVGGRGEPHGDAAGADGGSDAQGLASGG